MDQKDNKFHSVEPIFPSQGHMRNQHKGQNNDQQQEGISFIVRKAEKLTTALYLVTDIMSEKEPMKWKARESGVDLLSDMMIMSSSTASERMTMLRNAAKKIEQIVSFLDVAQGTHMMSEMNASVLKKEYTALKDSCLLEWQRISDGSKNIFTENFFEIHQPLVSPDESSDGPSSFLGSERVSSGNREPGFSGSGAQDLLRNLSAKTQQADSFSKDDLGGVDRLHIDTKNASHTPPRSEEVVRPNTPSLPRIAEQQISQGQKINSQASVVSDKQFSKVVNGAPSSQSKPITDMTGKNVITPPLSKTPLSSAQTFIPRATVAPSGIIERPRQDVGRDDRRKIILALIKHKPALTVKDIAKSIPGVSEKTIQRELFAMVADGVLTKKGDRRWSTYSLAV